jgi:hypothetical protein
MHARVLVTEHTASGAIVAALIVERDEQPRPLRPGYHDRRFTLADLLSIEDFPAVPAQLLDGRTNPLLAPREFIDAAVRALGVADA